MAIKYQGSGKFTYNLDVQAQKPLDSRLVVASYENDLAGEKYKLTFVLGGANAWYDGMLVYAEDTKKVYVLKGSEGFVEVGSDLIADAELSDTTYTFASATVAGKGTDEEGNEIDIEVPVESGAYFTVTEEGGTPQTVYVNADIAGAAAAALEAAKTYADSLPHKNTTYTFANGTGLGQFTVTPSNGTAQTVTVGGLDTAASKSADYFVKSEGYVAYSEPEKTKLAGIEAGAEVNIIETVKVNGVALIPDADRAVDVTIPDAAVKGVKSGDKVLALDSADGMLSTTISMEYKSTSEGGDGYIYLKGIGGAELGKIDAAEFVKDGMIDSVVMGENNVLTITWNTASGKTEATTIDFSKYIDTFTHYGARKGVKIVEDGDTSYYEGVVDPASETFLTVGEAGFKLSGVQTAINTAAAKATTVVVEGTDAGNNLSIVESTAADGHSIYTVNLTDVASAKDLSDLTTVVNENEHVTSAALNDLNARMVTAEGDIDALQAAVGGLDLGVLTVKGQGGEYVTVTPAEASKGDVTVSVSVSTTKATNSAYANDALATDGYVEEQAAAAVATAAADATSKANTAESNAKTYADNLMSWASF